MDLTPERKQQIEEEERLRVAEEQYRAQVRASLGTGGSTPGPPPRKSLFGLLLAIGAVAIAVTFFLVNNRINETPTFGSIKAASRAPSVRYVPATQKIASGQIVVRANGYVQYRFQITSEMRAAHVSGRFKASGGSGNDIEAVIAGEDEFTNWINGHPARVFYTTQGKKTTDTFDVRLGPGTYYLAFSNKFSALSSKDVFLEVDLNYQRLETD